MLQRQSTPAFSDARSVETKGDRKVLQGSRAKEVDAFVFVSQRQLASEETLVNELYDLLEKSPDSIMLRHVLERLPPHRQHPQWKRLWKLLLSKMFELSVSSPFIGVDLLDRLFKSVPAAASVCRDKSAARDFLELRAKATASLLAECQRELAGDPPCFRSACQLVEVADRCGDAEAQKLLQKATKLADGIAARGTPHLIVALGLRFVTLAHHRVHNRLDGCQRLAAGLLSSNNITNDVMKRTFRSIQVTRQTSHDGVRQRFSNCYLEAVLDLTNVPDKPFYEPGDIMNAFPPTHPTDAGLFVLDDAARHFVFETRDRVALFITLAFLPEVHAIDDERLVGFLKRCKRLSPFQLQCFTDGLAMFRDKRYWTAATCFIPLITDLVDQLTDDKDSKAPDDKILAIPRLESGHLWFLRLIYSIKHGGGGFVNVLSHNHPRGDHQIYAAATLLSAVVILVSVALTGEGEKDLRV